ncbi:FAD-dependent oxidoreductase [Pseudonocardia acidicola]|uniref:FAD-dependent monooxygenase n=1 Tax=Pseudonocardia acidicola TaxID=2724939 RepID=A0ABX1SAX6_9PSEU|nr:FAD-dependent monooxygenase [Pseudonocardia acidicola]
MGTSQTTVIVGGSIAGLLAAAAASPASEAVTIVERDDLPAGPEHRRGVPQGTQVHALLAVGQQNMERLLPGIVAELQEAGGTLVDGPGDLAVYTASGWTGRAPSDAKVVCARRPLIEWVIRKRVLTLPNVTVLKGNVTGLVANEDRTRVVGVSLRGADDVPADLVIDASGRSSKAPTWISDLGYDAPGEQELRSYVGYTTVPVRLPEDALPTGVAGVLSHPHPRNLRGGSVVPCDNGLHLVSALSMMNVDPPRDMPSLLEFVDRAASPVVGQVARTAEPVGDVVAYRMPGSRRRLWERLERRPEGFVAIGDAVMSFNPLYGQGMSLAAVEAVLLADTLADVSDLREPGLAGRIQGNFTATIETVFGIVVGTDSAYEGAELDGIEPPSADAAAFKKALSELATEDAEVSLAVKYVGHYFKPELLTAPAIREKVERWITEGRTSSKLDPTTIPGPVG